MVIWRKKVFILVSRSGHFPECLWVVYSSYWIIYLEYMSEGATTSPFTIRDIIAVSHTACFLKTLIRSSYRVLNLVSLWQMFRMNMAPFFSSPFLGYSRSLLMSRISVHRLTGCCVICWRGSARSMTSVCPLIPYDLSLEVAVFVSNRVDGLGIVQ